METKDFVWSWKEGERWSYSPGTMGSEMESCLYFWNKTQAEILKGLQEEINNGWKPITEVGPSAFKLREYTVTEHHLGLFNVAAWFFTLGIAFLVDLATGFGASKRLWYETVEFRVSMMKE